MYWSGIIRPRLVVNGESTEGFATRGEPSGNRIIPKLTTLVAMVWDGIDTDYGRMCIP